MDKSPDAFRTISEVAEHLETPAHVLRFWESRFPQIRPVKRAGGRRYYRPSDVSLLTGIKRLLHDEGMTIRGVQKILREQGVRHVSGLSGLTFDDPMADQDQGGGAPYFDVVEDVVVRLVAEPTPFLREPDLASAMAKAAVREAELDQAPHVPIPALPATEPVQEALLLTPSRAQESAERSADVEARLSAPGDGVTGQWTSVAEGDTSFAAATNADAREADDRTERDLFSVAGALAPAAMDPSEQGSADGKLASDVRSGDTTSSAWPGDGATDEIEGGHFDDDGFDDDDFEDGPATTVAARIRALPSEASAARVGAELLAIVARLQALRDGMAEAGRTALD